MSQPIQTQPEPAKKGSEFGVKIPSRDDFKLTGLVDTSYVDTILRRRAEQFSSIELAEIVRGDSITGDVPTYSVVSDITEFKKRHNPTSSLTSLNRGQDFLSRYQINLSLRIPDEAYISQNNLDETYKYFDEDNQLVTREKSFVYIDLNGDLIIELDNMNSNETVEVQLDINGTIYKVE